MPQARVDSAGTSDWHVGDAPYGPMQLAARARGYELGRQRARQVTAEDFHRFDLILAMDEKNLADLQAMRPAGSPADLALYLDVLDEGPRNVPDPYYTRDFDGVLALIEEAARAWNDRLSASP
jgi:protein-tyrosine phosphatase